jgi:hypothetical protein
MTKNWPSTVSLGPPPPGKSVFSKRGPTTAAALLLLGQLHGRATCANLSSMSTMQTAPLAGLTPRERDYIRRELDMFFSTLPTVAEGFQLKTWRGGPNAGKPKVSPTAGGLVERGLMRLDTSQLLPRLFFTEAGLAELRAMIRWPFCRPEKICSCPPGTRDRSGRLT